MDRLPEVTLGGIDERDRRSEMQNRASALRDLWGQRGKRYERCTFGNFTAATQQQKAALATARDYAVQVQQHVKAGRGLVFYGPPGTGKDHLLACVMRRAIQVGVKVAWHSGVRLFVDLRDCIDGNGSEREWLRAVVRPPVLAISDPVSPIGELTRHQAEMFFTALDERYSHMRPTWVTANVAGNEDADGRLTASIMDRLKDGSVVVPCDWASYRKPLQANKDTRR